MTVVSGICLGDMKIWQQAGEFLLTVLRRRAFMSHSATSRRGDRFQHQNSMYHLCLSMSYPKPRQPRVRKTGPGHPRLNPKVENHDDEYLNPPRFKLRQYRQYHLDCSLIRPPGADRTGSRPGVRPENGRRRHLHRSARSVSARALRRRDHPVASGRTRRHRQPPRKASKC
jgi:hypothetical protein